MNNNLMFSSKSNECSTPQDFFDELNNIYNFTLDPCANNENHKCDKYYTIEENGLLKSWDNEIVFMNPPYGREIGKWMKKAYNEKEKAIAIVCLIPSRTDTKYWHEYAMEGEIYFVKGRLKFENKKNGAPFPSAIIIFGKILDITKIKTYNIQKPNKLKTT